MDDLARWFGEQLDIDTAGAEAATWCEEAGVWRAGASPFDTRGADQRWYVEDVMDDGVVTHVDPKASDCEGVARHIAAQSPARVLREIEAKRQIVDGLRPELEAGAGLTDGEGLRRWMVAYAVLRHLASPYADRPGYREEWRP